MCWILSFLVVLCNLEPRKLVGIVSNGMVIAASNNDKSKTELLEPPRKLFLNKHTDTQIRKEN
jgi:tRNA-binding EMAP/Myf-like protein